MIGVVEVEVALFLWRVGGAAGGASTCAIAIAVTARVDATGAIALAVRVRATRVGVRAAVSVAIATRSGRLRLGVLSLYVLNLKSRGFKNLWAVRTLPR